MNIHGARLAPLTDEQRARVEANTALVPFYLKRLGDPMDGARDDDIQDGMFGLMAAAQSFDASKGSFANYALRAIVWHVQRGRDIRGGVSYRHDVRNGDRWHQVPDSLDRPLRQPEGFGDVELTLGAGLVDEPYEPSTAPERAEPLLNLLSERDRVVVLQPSRDAAEALGIKQASILKRRVRLYARLREQVAS